MKVLTVDLGASSGRVMVVTYQSNKLSVEEINRFSHTIQEVGDNLKWDIDYISKNVIEGVKLALKKYNDIASIGIDTWGCDYCYVDNKGSLVRAPFSYRDVRTTRASEEVLKIYSKTELYKKFGMQFLPFNSIFQIYDDFHNQGTPMINDYTLLMMADYLAFLLTGERRLEVTNASTMSLFLLPEFTLSYKHLQTLEIPNNIFPKLIKPGQKYGNLKKEFIPSGNKINIPVIAVCSHDTSSAILGTNVMEGDAYISSGTWSLVGTESNKPIINDEMCKYNLTNELGYQNKYNILKNTMGMFLVNNIRQEWKYRKQEVKVEQITQLVKNSPEINSYFDPDHELFQTPFNMSYKMIKYLKNTSQTIPIFKGQWLSMIYMSMACKYRTIIEEIEKVSKRKINSIVICGGGNQAEVLNEFTANITKKIVKQGPKEATVIGNALAQLIALGEIKDEIEGRKIVATSFGGKTYIPDNSPIWEEKYKSFKKVLNKGDE